VLGVFDSGCGGLTVLRAIRGLLPDRAVMYLGDSARLPYGERSREEVTRYTQECCTALFERGCSLIVLACNTASADTLRELQREWLPAFAKASAGRPRNVIGVIRPLAEEAVLRTQNNRIAVVGTRSTVASGAYERELKKLRPGVTVIQHACPLLVPLIEEGFLDQPETRRILRRYLRPVKAHNPDVLILGCTHYEALHPLFARKMGRRCAVLHSPQIVAEKLREYLARHPEYDEAIPRTGEIHFLTTGDPARFAEGGERFYGAALRQVEQVTL
jgi:glutamate racemase